MIQKCQFQAVFSLTIVCCSIGLRNRHWLPFWSDTALTFPSSWITGAHCSNTRTDVSVTSEFQTSPKSSCSRFYKVFYNNLLFIIFNFFLICAARVQPVFMSYGRGECSGCSGRHKNGPLQPQWSPLGVNKVLRHHETVPWHGLGCHSRPCGPQC